MPDRVTWSDLRGQRSRGHSTRPDWDQGIFSQHQDKGLPMPHQLRLWLILHYKSYKAIDIEAIFRLLFKRVQI